MCRCFLRLYLWRTHESISNSGKDQLKGIFLSKSFSTFVMDEVGIKVARTGEAWNFGFLAASSKSLFIFISFFNYVAKRDELSMGIKVLEHKERGFITHLSSQVIFFPLTGQLPAILAVVYISFAQIT